MQQQKQRSVTNSLRLNWTEIKIENIIGGVSSDGVSYLDLFLEDFKKVFNVKNPNKNCNTCIREYYKRYTQRLHEMETNCKYILHKKYNGLPLEISGKNSSISVTNSNITDAYAKILLKRFKDPSKVFSTYPKELPEVVVEEVKPTEETPKKKTRKRKK